MSALPSYWDRTLEKMNPEMMWRSGGAGVDFYV
jgi:hypothetical protein